MYKSFVWNEIMKILNGYNSFGKILDILDCLVKIVAF